LESNRLVLFFLSSVSAVIRKWEISTDDTRGLIGAVGMPPQ